ncbi:MAG: glycosyltransferase [Clostridia bacterium]|nr:glycosyltransferase [Clostridia bacterium]
MKKILFVVDEKKLGGVSIVLENLLNNLDLTNLDIDVLVLHNSGTSLTNLNDKINIIYGTKAFNVVDQDFKNLMKTGHVIKALRKFMLSYKMKTNNMKSFILSERKKMGLKVYDVEIAFKSGFCSFVVAYSNAKEKINWVHEDYETYNRTKRYENTFKEVFDLFDKHVIVSDKAAKSFNDIYHMDEKTFVIENYINENALKEQATKDDVKLDGSKINIVSLGRFCYEKGFDRLIDAVKILKDKLEGLNIKVNILGYGEFENSLKEQIANLGLEHIIEIHNTITMKYNPYAFVKANDIFVMASRSESFGMTRIEALILGLPVITTNVANSDKLIQKEYGIIVENSTEGITQGIETLITNKELLVSLKDNVKSYSYSEQNNEIIKQVQKLLEE